MSLFQLEREGDTEALSTSLRQSDNPTVRRRAAELIGQLDDTRPRIVGALAKAVQEDDDPAVRAEAIDAIASLGMPALDQLVADAVGGGLLHDDDELGDHQRTQLYSRALSADSPELRMAAAIGLGHVADRRSTPALVGALDDGDASVRARAARALGRIGDARAASALVDSMSDPSPEVRFSTASALSAIGAERALPALVEHHDDPNPDVRRVVVEAIGEYGGLEQLTMLVEALGDDAADVRETAMYSLLDLMSRAPEGRGQVVRKGIVDTIRSNDAADVVPPLADIVERTNRTEPRRNATWLLGRVTGEAHRERAIRVLVAALDDADDSIRSVAASSLAAIGGMAAEKALLDVIDDRDLSDEARSRAVTTLGRIGSESALDRLRRLVESTSDPMIRSRAFAAAQKLEESL